MHHEIVDLVCNFIRFDAVSAIASIQHVPARRKPLA